MQKKHIMAAAMAIGMMTQVQAADTFDLGKVQVVGKDAQSAKIDAAQYQLDFDMGDRNAAMPELVPETSVIEFRPITEKQTLKNIHKEDKDELSVAVGVGTRSAKELVINGRGTRDGYVGNVSLISEDRNGYQSSVDTSKTSLEGSVAVSESNYNAIAGAEYTNEEYAIRSRKDTAYNPSAGLENRTLRLYASGNSTQGDGAFIKGNASINSIERNLNNPFMAGSDLDQNVFSISADASYLKKLNDKVRGKASLELRKDTFESGNDDCDLTKTVIGVGAEYEISKKAVATAGFKSMNMKSKNKAAPFASLDYRFDEPWQLVLSYDEDLGNDDLEELYMPSHFVAGTDLEASRKKVFKGSLNYKTSKGDTIGVDMFSQTEIDAAEYIDVFSAGKQLLESQINYVGKAKRKGTTIHGNFKIEDCFSINLKGTLQTPEDDGDGHRLSYEPKKILEAGFNFTKNKLMLDFSRRAEYDREARTRADVLGAAAASVSAEDYSRSDLIIRYKFNDKYSSYIKIKDLYDEAKELRYNVEEEGRVTLAGLEAHF